MVAIVVGLTALSLGVGLGVGINASFAPRSSPPPLIDASLFISVDSGRVSFTKVIPYDPAKTTAGGLLDAVGAALRVDPQYVVLFREEGVADRKNRRVLRREKQRIGCTSTCAGADSLNALKLSTLGIVPGDTIMCYLRPLRGDHIHLSFSVYVHGELVDVLFDSPWLRTPDANEGNTYPRTYANLSEGMFDYHITQLQPHFGIHAGQSSWFGDSMIHAHPGTSWSWYQGTEGLGANLDAFLGQVGAAYYDTLSQRYPMGGWHVPGDYNLRSNAMTFPDVNGGQVTQVGGECALGWGRLPSAAAAWPFGCWAAANSCGWRAQGVGRGAPYPQPHAHGSPPHLPFSQITARPWSSMGGRRRTSARGATRCATLRPSRTRLSK